MTCDICITIFLLLYIIYIYIFISNIIYIYTYFLYRYKTNRSGTITVCVLYCYIYRCQEFPRLGSCPLLSSLGRKNPVGSCQVFKPSMCRCAGVACLAFLNPPQRRLKICHISSLLFTFLVFKHRACPSST